MVIKKRMWKLLSLYAPYKLWCGFVLLSSLLAAGISLLYPLCIRYITQLTLEKNTEIAQEIIRTGIMMFLLVFVERVLSLVYDYYGHCLGASMENDLRFELFERLEYLPQSYHDQQKTGKLMSMLTNDLLSLSELLHHGPEDYIICFAKFAGASSILFVLDGKLAAIILLFMPLMVFLTLYCAKKEKQKVKASQIQIGNINAQAEDTLSGIREVKSYTLEKEQYRKFCETGGDFLKSRKSQYLAEAESYQSIMFVKWIIYIAVVIAGGILIGRGSMDLPDLLAFLLYIDYLTEPVGKLAWMTTQFQQGMAGFERAMDVIELPVEDSAGKDADLLGDISFQHVYFQYDTEGTEVLSDINIEIRHGDFMGIIGASGKGKTTISALLTRLYEPNSGMIKLDGINSREINIYGLRRNIAVVSQENYLFDTTIYDNIAIGRKEAGEAEIVQAAKDAQIHDFIMSLPQGYRTFVGEKGIRLSGGQRQRICIARALLKDASILILDEATSALDEPTQDCIMKRIKAVRRGKTTIVITHRLAVSDGLDYVINLEES